jgi:hypothetical protein
MIIQNVAKCLTLCFSLMLAAGCNNATRQTSNSDTQAESVAFQTIEKGVWSKYYAQEIPLEQPTLIICRTREDFMAFWNRHNHQPDHYSSTNLPEVDFTQDMVVIVMDSMEPSTGYDLTIAEIQKSPSGLIVRAQKEEPSPESIVCDALTEPYHIITIPSSNDPITLYVNENGITND